MLTSNSDKRHKKGLSITLSTRINLQCAYAAVYNTHWYTAIQLSALASL